MAKNTDWGDVAEGIGKAAGGVFGGLKKAAHDTFEEAQAKIREITRMVLKSLTVFLFFVLGIVYALTGVAKYLDATQGYIPGTGALIVGASLLILGLFAYVIRK